MLPGNMRAGKRARGMSDAPSRNPRARLFQQYDEVNGVVVDYYPGNHRADTPPCTDHNCKHGLTDSQCPAVPF